MSLSISTGDYYIHWRPLVKIAVLLFIRATSTHRTDGSLSFLSLSARDADCNLEQQGERRRKSERCESMLTKKRNDLLQFWLTIGREVLMQIDFESDERIKHKRKLKTEKKQKEKKKKKKKEERRLWNRDEERKGEGKRTAGYSPDRQAAS